MDLTNPAPGGSYPVDTGSADAEKKKEGPLHISCRPSLIPFVSCLISFVTDWASARVYLLAGEGHFVTSCSGERGTPSSGGEGSCVAVALSVIA